VRSVSCGNGFTVASVATEWMNNDAALICMRCSRPFTTFFRKHHCRLCGGVFCTECSSSKTPLLKLGYIEPVRVCDGCFARV
jgi:growth factor-regulated tyrosine kinase substrate